MKLVYFIPLLSTRGGQERTLTDKANWLAQHGHEVMFVTYEHDGPLAYTLDDNVQHIDIACHYFRLYRYPVWQRFYKVLQLKKCFRLRFYQVLKEFQPDVIVVAIPNTENFLPDLVKEAGRIPLVIESHLAHGYEVIRRGITERWLHLLYNPTAAISKANLLIALTEGDASYWRQYLKKVCVIPNPVTCYPLEIPQSTFSTQQFRIICVGRLAPQKRFDRIINAFSLIADKYPEWHLDIYGNGELHEELQRQIAKLSLLDRVHIYPPTSDIYTEYQRSRFFVLSSDFEGFGLVVVEAMACGIPVVSTDCPYGPSEIIEDGKTGLLAKMDVKDLAEKMEWMITHEKERKEMGIRARQSVVRYKKENVMKEWESAYLSVLDCK